MSCTGDIQIFATGRLVAALVMLLAAAPASGEGPPPSSTAAPAIEPPTVAVRLHLLPLTGPAAAPMAEISAMFWFGDDLILVPQFPERLGSPRAPACLVLARQEIAAALADTAQARGPRALRPRVAPVVVEDLPFAMPGWDGLEAAAVDGRELYLAVEAEIDGRMGGYLLRGCVEGEPGARRVIIDTDRIASIPQPANLPNLSQEALVVSRDEVFVLYETYGRNVNPRPTAAVFGRDLEFRRASPCEAMEFRVTDATDLDEAGRFWIINYYWPGDEEVLEPVVPSETTVERLVELQLRDDRIIPSGRPVLDLRDDPAEPARNWEAIVRFAGGFLLMTDAYPTTLLAYVALPAELTATGKDRSP